MHRLHDANVGDVITCHVCLFQLVPGETALAFYTATNPTDEPITGISTYNVIPFEAGQYFNKIQVSLMHWQFAVCEIKSCIECIVFIKDILFNLRRSRKIRVYSIRFPHKIATYQVFYF